MQTEIRTEPATETLARPPADEIPRTWLEAPADAEVWELELSPRAHRALLRAGATTVGEVQALRPWQVARLYGVGPKTMGELEPLFALLKDRPTPEPRLEDAVDEIVDSVLDAADVEILADLGDGPAVAPGPAARQGALLLRQLMVDVLLRHRERKRREKRISERREEKS